MRRYALPVVTHVPEATQVVTVNERGTRRFSYAVAGVLVSTGAPLGLLLFRAVFGSVHSVSAEFLSERVTYVYVLAAALVFTLFGYVLGRHFILRALDWLNRARGPLRSRRVT